MTPVSSWIQGGKFRGKHCSAARKISTAPFQHWMETYSTSVRGGDGPHKAQICMPPINPQTTSLNGTCNKNGKVNKHIISVSKDLTEEAGSKGKSSCSVFKQKVFIFVSNLTHRYSEARRGIFKCQNKSPMDCAVDLHAIVTDAHRHPFTSEDYCLCVKILKISKTQLCCISDSSKFFLLPLVHCVHLSKHALYTIIWFPSIVCCASSTTWDLLSIICFSAHILVSASISLNILVFKSRWNTSVEDCKLWFSNHKR
jgi:hypothetical protein